MGRRFPLFRTGFSGVTIGGGGGQPVHLVILTIIVLAMALISVWDSVTSGMGGGVNLDKKIPFKCTKCGAVVWYTIRDLQKMQKPGAMPMMGPMKLDCPKCGGKGTLVQAVQCPKCGEIFIMKMDPKTGMFDDKCPKCGASYSAVLREKYRKKRK